MKGAPEGEGGAYRVRLFGSFALLDPRGRDLTPASRKARALLAYLLLNPGPVARSRLASLLWGDRGEEQARASLRQTFYELRALSAEANPLLVVDRIQARLAPDLVHSDLSRLQALRSGGALDLGVFAEPNFLDDLHDVDAGFDDWLAAERSRRCDERRVIGIGAAERALVRGDPAEARTLAEALLGLEPFDEEVARLAMEACARLGDSEGMKRAHARHAGAVRKDLGLSPSPELTALLERLSAGAQVMRRPSAPPIVSRPSETTRIGRRAPWPVVWGALALIVLAAAGLLAWRSGLHDHGPRTVAVEPLRVSVLDAAARTLADGLSSDVAQMIVGDDANLRILDANDRPQSPTEYRVTGEARSGTDGLHADLRLIDPRTKSILWSRSFTRAVGDADGLRDQMAAHLADVMICGLGGRNPHLSTLGIEAMRLYLQACAEKHGDWSRSAALLAQVVRLRPKFAHAWAMLAAATAATGTEAPAQDAPGLFHTARLYAERALKLDPHDGETYSALHDIIPPDTRHWIARYEVLERALATELDNANANIDMAEELSAVGRDGEALPFARRVAQLDPDNQWAFADLIAEYGFHWPDGVGPYIAVAERRWPNNPDLENQIFRFEARAGDPAEAERRLDDPRHVFRLAPERVAYWRALIRSREGGSRAEAIRLYGRDLASNDVDTLFSAANAFAILGRPDLAFAALDRIGSRPVPATALMFRNYWAPVRADPRFMTVAARQGLVAIWTQTGRWPDFCTDLSLPYRCASVARTL